MAKEKGILFPIDIGIERKTFLKRYCYFNRVTVSKLVRDAIDTEIGFQEEGKE